MRDRKTPVPSTTKRAGALASRHRLLSRAAPLALLAAAACSGAPTPEGAAPPSPSAAAPETSTKASTTMPAPTADKAFSELAARFLSEYLRLSPVRATEAGDHSHDATWPDVTEAGDAAVRKLAEQTRADLAALERADLGVQNRIDAQILENQTAYWLFAIDSLKEAENNPLYYTGLVGDGIDPLITRNFAPEEERMKSLLGRLQGIPALVAAAKKRLGHPAKVHTETAIQQNKGLVDLMEHGLAESFAKVPAQRASLESAAKAAAASLSDFQTFLEKELLPRSDGSFRIGKELFEKKLRYSLEDDVSGDEIVKGARALLAQTQAEMVETSKELWPTLGLGAMPKTDTADEKRAFVKKALDQIAKERPTDKTIVADAKRLLDATTAFVKEKDLVGLPEEPCQIIEMPEYRRGVAIAYCDSSGPLEKKPETFYAIAPTPKDWTKKRSESFYREYNQSMLADLTVHEAMPGHYLQLMHANRFHSDVRAVFGSGPFVEGWAVYGEWLMSKHGFGGARVRLSRQKMVLRLAANAILDHEIHAGTMEEKDALELMTKEAFQEEGEAVGKWKRARLTSAQLTTYYYGFTEMMKLRMAAEKQPGFSERAYHDKLLSFGSPAMRHARELMGQAGK